MIRVCSMCKEMFETKYQNKNYCSFKCQQASQRKRSRESMRAKRHNDRKRCKPCVVCGFSLTTDIHHEGSKEYVLCPNHHALITRNINSIKEVLQMKGC